MLRDTHIIGKQCAYIHNEQRIEAVVGLLNLCGLGPVFSEVSCKCYRSVKKIDKTGRGWLSLIMFLPDFHAPLFFAMNTDMRFDYAKDEFLASISALCSIRANQ